MGRTFDRQILDMIEVGVVRFKSMDDYGGKVPKKRIGSKPLMMFLGEWEQNDNTKRLQSFLVDFYRGDPVDKLVVQGLDHLMVFTLTEKVNPLDNINTIKTIHQRTYFCKLKKNPNGGTNGSKIPVPYLMPCGPDLDMAIRREQFASLDMWRAAIKQPAAAKKKKIKNQSTNMFGETIGRLHLERQDIDNMQGRKSKALRRAEKMEKEEKRAAVDQELQQEHKELGDEFKRDFGFDNQEVKAKKK